MNLTEWLTIELTTKCDLRCNNCFALAALESKSSMSLERAKGIVEEGWKSGFKNLHLTGGEVTLWKGLFELLDYSFQIGYRSVYFNTHGGYLSEEYCSRLAQYLDKITLTISLNGPEEIHETVRGKGTYSKAIEGIANALSYNLKVELFVVVGKRLLSVLPGFVHSIMNLFPRLEKVTLIQLHRVESDYYDVRKDLLTPSEYIQMIQIANFLKLYGFPMTILDNSLSNVVSHKIGMQYLPHSPNIEGEGRLVVLLDGKITGSHSSRSEFGKYEKGAFQRILASEEYLRRTGKDREICPDCRHFSDCSTNMNPRPSLEYCDFESVPFCKRVMDLLEFS
ncbi:hypothetical protein CH373_17595 [Leptospira perolatii]|uniref:Radical SAM core domain-containing protein n=1 Tax=Leptospira perolatii TaxID=2023191 RepID=A0A2M9ZIA3_9LEPT|nr:radical SAM protein [Leptospira perolatii]PJZ69086.1 hypothetical protein CH360_12440 [Leptospira perolatii]PJZ71795.1 hypothetical protein CH373_17595 [Leptospira perolatii]